ncbi:MAG: hypothetical protein U0795_15960 [Pirellulales bacterium]
MHSQLRPFYGGFWLAMVAFGPFSVGMATPPDDSSMASIVSTVRNRVTAANGFELTWTEQEARLAGGQERLSTIHYRLCSVDKLLAFEFQVAAEPTAKVDQAADEYRGVFDGKATWELRPKPETLSHPCGFVNRTENLLDLNFHVQSAKLAMGVGLAETLEQPNVQLLDQREEIDGHQCVMLKVPLGRDFSWFWLDEHHDYRVVQWENRPFDRRQARRLKISYEQTGGPVPLENQWQVKGWELQIPEGNKIFTATVKTLQNHQRFPVGTFRIYFPPETVVCDILAPELVVDSVVAEDGTWKALR